MVKVRVYCVIQFSPEMVKGRIWIGLGLFEGLSLVEVRVVITVKHKLVMAKIRKRLISLLFFGYGSFSMTGFKICALL